jgi:hypothetical protein
LTLALLMLSVPTELRAQQLQASLSHYSTEDGMPSNTVAALRTDDYGFLWEVMKQTFARTLLVKNPTSSLDNIS